MTNEEWEELAAQNAEKLESTKLLLLSPGDDDYHRVEAQLLYILNAPLDDETRRKGSHAFSMLVSYLRSCQTGYDLRSLKEWYIDYREALKDASFTIVPSSEEEIDEFLYLAGTGLQSLYDHALAMYRGASKPTIVSAMLTALLIIIKTTNLTLGLIKNHHGRLQIAESIK